MFAAISFGAHLRVDVGVQRVDEDIEDDEPDADDDDRPLDDRPVARLDAVDDDRPQSGPVEDRLGDDGAADERPELQTQDGDDGDERVPQGVLVADERLGQALRAGGPDVGLAQLL